MALTIDRIRRDWFEQYQDNVTQWDISSQHDNVTVWEWTRTGLLRIRIMLLSGIVGQGAGSLVFQWGCTVLHYH